MAEPEVEWEPRRKWLNAATGNELKLTDERALEMLEHGWDIRPVAKGGMVALTRKLQASVEMAA